MTRTKRRAGTKTKVMAGRGSDLKPPKYKYPVGTKYHPRRKAA